MITLRSSRRLSGFTLIELLVVIVILGILMAVALPTYLRQQSKAKDSNAQQQLSYAYRAIRSALPEFNNSYPSAPSAVSLIQQSEPELQVTSGGCNGATTDKQVQVDPVLTSASKLSLYTKSSSGNWWRLDAGTSGTPTFHQLATCTGPLSAATATVNGGEITDTIRRNSVQGDGESPGSDYGMWPATTNLLFDGGFESGSSGWGVWSGSAMIAPSADAKFGSGSAQVTGTPNYGIGFYGTGNPPTVTGSTNYTFSVWVKTPTASTFSLGVRWRDSTQATITQPVTAISAVQSGVWTRIQATWASPSNAASAIPFIDETTNPLSYFLVDGAQFEASYIATPYVETNGAAAGRLDGAVEAPATLLDPTQGWVAARVRPTFGSSTGDPGYNAYVFSWGRSMTAGTDWIALRHNAGAGSNWNATMQINQTVVATTNVAVSWQPGSTLTLILSWDANAIHLSINGSQLTTVTKTTPGQVPTIVQTKFEIGDYLSSYGQLTGDMLWFAAGKGTVSDSDVQTINSWGDNDPTTQDFPAAAQATIAWTADSTTYVSGN